MQDLVLVGAGGLALEICDYILNEDQPCRVKGFISDYNFEKFMLVHPTIPHLGKIVDYQIKENEQLVICIGDARARKKIIQNLEAKKAIFFRFVSKRASVSRKAQLGKGVLICPFVTVSSQTEVGDFVFFNNYSGIGHNSSVGAYSVLNSYAGIAGDSLLVETW